MYNWTSIFVNVSPVQFRINHAYHRSTIISTASSFRFSDYMQYCDGMSFSGRNDSVLTVDTDTGPTNLYFRGSYILEEIFDILISSYGLDSATDVVVSLLDTSASTL